MTLDLANVYHAAYLTRAKLDEQGYVKVNIKLSARDPENLQRIEFTDKAEPFLIGAVEQKQQKSASLLGGTYAAYNQKIATYNWISTRSSRFASTRMRTRPLSNTKPYLRTSPPLPMWEQSPRKASKKEKRLQKRPT
jgi:hypothetical protein